MRYPDAPRQDRTDPLHGHDVPDPYRWLEDPDSPATTAWSEAQDVLWRTHAATLSARDRLRELGLRFADVGMITAPRMRGGRRFFLRRAGGQEHPVLYTALDKNLDDSLDNSAEEVLVDPMELDPTGATTLDAWHVDPSGRRLAFQISRGGSEQAVLYVLDIADRRVMDGPIDRCRYSPVAWLADGGGFYYVRSRRVHLHRIGTDADDDPLVLAPDSADDLVGYGLGISADGRWLAVSAKPGSATRNDLWLADLREGPAERPRFRVVQRDVEARSVLLVADERMYVVTDRDAPKVRLCTAHPDTPTEWRELIPEDPEAVFSDFTVLDAGAAESVPNRKVLLVARSRQGVSELALHDAESGKLIADVPLPGSGTIGPLCGHGHEAWFEYTDLLTPGAVWRYDAHLRVLAPWADPPGATVTPDVETHRLSCAAPDGTPVRVTLLRPAGSAGPLSTILYGYGGFGIPLTPSYAADTLAWLAAGGAVAIAHLRGGGEDGLTSHRAGTGGRKQYVFDDFIAVAEHLIAEGWTRSERLGIWGESNGGLLTAAALTRRPDLFAAVVCMAPLTDMVRYELSGLGGLWRGEYGSAADPEQFRWLYGYSPYHYVESGAPYPATLFVVSDGDSRVDPLHARKMCAALQWATSASRPILLRREAEVGHGARAVGRALALAGDLLAFMAAHTGLDHVPGPAPAGG